LSGSERRRHRRYATSHTARASAAKPDATPFVVEVVNVSESGLGIVSVRDLSIGAEFYLTLADFSGAPLHGIVRWIDTGGGPIYAGIEFLEIDPEQAKALRGLVAAIDKEEWGVG